MKKIRANTVPTTVTRGGIRRQEKSRPLCHVWNKPDFALVLTSLSVEKLNAKLVFEKEAQREKKKGVGLGT